MRVAHLAPCYIDQLYPHVGLATLDVLERLGVEVDFPAAQTCCGQPLLNLGCVDESRPVAQRAVDIFSGYDAVVCPSASCTAMMRRHYPGLVGGDAARQVSQRTYELCEFLVDVLGVDRIEGSFPHRVGLHEGCHGLRELRLGDKVARLLRSLDGLELVELEHSDECCGFGGTFAVTEEAVSCRMGEDRLADHERAGAEVLTSADMSCLMHLDGLRRRRATESWNPIVMHVAEILAGRGKPA